MKTWSSCLLIILCLGCSRSSEQPRTLPPNISEGFEGANTGQLERIKVIHYVGTSSYEFNILGESYSRPLFADLYSSFHADVNRWQALPELDPSLISSSSWYIGIFFRNEKFVAGKYTNFGFYVPKSDKTLLSPACTGRLLKIESVCKRGKPIYGKEENK